MTYQKIRGVPKGTPSGRTLAERFWLKVDKRGPDECWMWLGSLHEDGYGQIWMDGRTQRAHRASLRVHGLEPPPYDGGTARCYVVDHACSKPGCVNPRHLRIVTQEENCGVLARNNPFYRNKTTMFCAKGHPYTPENTALKVREGKKPARVCLTCFPGNWRFAIVPRERPKGALTPEGYLKRFGRPDPTIKEAA
jgi:hypothetical protein